MIFFAESLLPIQSLANYQVDRYKNNISQDHLPFFQSWRRSPPSQVKAK